jgi:hypothetical protein
MSFDSRTRNYVDRRTKEGLPKKEIIRCLKRYAARRSIAVSWVLTTNRSIPSRFVLQSPNPIRYICVVGR